MIICRSCEQRFRDELDSATVDSVFDLNPFRFVLRSQPNDCRKNISKLKSASVDPRSWKCIVGDEINKLRQKIEISF